MNILKKNYNKLKNYYLIYSTLGLLLCFIMQLDIYAKYISFFLILLGLPFVVVEILSKRFFKLSYSKWIVGFFVFYSITMLLSAKTDFISSLHVYIWLLIYMILFYSSGSELSNKHDLIEYITKYFKIISVIMFVFTLIAFLSFVFRNYVDYDLFFLGGRARSILIDPIQLSWVSFISLTTSASLFFVPKINRKWKLFSMIAIITSFISTAISMTRTTEYGMYAFLVISSFLFFFVFFHKGNIKKSFKTFIKYFCVFIIAVFIVYPLMKNSLIFVSNIISPSEEVINEEGYNNLDELGRNDYENGVFKYGLSGRFEIWVMGINVVKEHPLFGVGSGDMTYQTVKINKGSDIYETTYPYFEDRVFISQHNGFMQVLVASGILGFITTTGFMILLSADVLKYIFKKRENDLLYLIIVISSNVAVVFYVLGFGQSISFFMVSYFSAYFWICLGFLRSLIQINQESEESKE